MQIDTLSAKFENRLLPKKPWTSSKMTAGRLDAMKKAIVGLVMTVEEVEGSFKLNQHKSDADYAAIATALASQARRRRADDRAADARDAAAGFHYRQQQQRSQRLKGACHDPHRHPAADAIGATDKSPPCLSMARPERRASAFRSA